ncbi:MAG: membrane protein insertase YidC [Spirochaetes bacterium]|jgi:YidC/Oxa1 family membrane protein insertase|nr:membrane protein insertase YidC [Spirochaetota bacterium]
MDKNTLYAVILSVVVITVGFMVQNMLYPPEPVPQQVQEQTEGTTQPGSTAQTEGQQTPGTDETSEPQPTGEPARELAAGAVAPVPEDGISAQTRTYGNDVIDVTFSPRGASVTSFRLLEHLADGEPVDMIFRGREDQAAFRLHFGGPDSEADTALYHYRDTTDPNTVEFYRDFYVVGNEAEPFRVIKRYNFQPGEYLFEVEVEIENSVNAFIPLNFDGTAYTLEFGPQIGPEFQELDRRTEYRRYYTYSDGDRNTVRMGRGDRETITEQIDWASIIGKYFNVVGVLDAAQYTTVMSAVPEPGLDDASKIFFSRSTIQSSRNTDTFRFFIGPKVARVLESYNDVDDNAWGVQGLDLQESMDTRFLLGWLENLLKAILNFIVRFVPNYGIAIIILTILVKALLFPLTHKSYESTAKMQELSPKMQEVREKYKDNPQKMNAEMANMYKKEGVNPLGGCLPLMLQLPFFIAMFGLFNNHFDLRGATFIPGWINDLSAPESILNFGSFTLPILGWNDLRLLPILFVGTQLITSKIMQNPGASTQQMRMITYMLPIVFFFVLYNMPSGLLVYWIVTNVLTAAQQYFNNRKKHRHA